MDNSKTNYNLRAAGKKRLEEFRLKKQQKGSIAKGSASAVKVPAEEDKSLSEFDSDSSLSQKHDAVQKSERQGPSGAGCALSLVAVSEPGLAPVSKVQPQLDDSCLTVDSKLKKLPEQKEHVNSFLFASLDASDSLNSSSQSNPVWETISGDTRLEQDENDSEACKCITQARDSNNSDSTGMPFASTAALSDRNSNCTGVQVESEGAGLQTYVAEIQVLQGQLQKLSEEKEQVSRELLVKAEQQLQETTKVKSLCREMELIQQELNLVEKEKVQLAEGLAFSQKELQTKTEQLISKHMAAEQQVIEAMQQVSLVSAELEVLKHERDTENARHAFELETIQQTLENGQWERAQLMTELSTSNKILRELQEEKFSLVDKLEQYAKELNSLSEEKLHILDELEASKRYVQTLEVHLASEQKTLSLKQDLLEETSQLVEEATLARVKLEALALTKDHEIEAFREQVSLMEANNLCLTHDVEQLKNQLDLARQKEKRLCELEACYEASCEQSRKLGEEKVELLSELEKSKLLFDTMSDDRSRLLANFDVDLELIREDLKRREKENLKLSNELLESRLELQGLNDQHVQIVGKLEISLDECSKIVDCITEEKSKVVQELNLAKERLLLLTEEKRGEIMDLVRRKVEDNMSLLTLLSESRRKLQMKSKKLSEQATEVETHTSFSEKLPQEKGTPATNLLEHKEKWYLMQQSVQEHELELERSKEFLRELEDDRTNLFGQLVMSINELLEIGLDKAGDELELVAYRGQLTKLEEENSMLVKLLEDSKKDHQQLSECGMQSSSQHTSKLGKEIVLSNGLPEDTERLPSELQEDIEHWQLLQHEFAQSSRGYISEFEEHLKQLAETEGNITMVANNFMLSGDELLKLKMARASLQEGVAQYKEQLVKVEDVNKHFVGGLNKHIESFDKTIDEDVVLLNQHDCAMEGSREQLKDLEETNVRLTAHVEQLLMDLQELSSDKSKKDLELETWKEQFLEIADKNRKLSSDFSKCEDELQLTMKDKAEQEARLVSELERYKQQACSLGEDNAALMIELEDCKKDLDSLERQNGLKMSQIEQLQHENQELIESREQAISKLAVALTHIHDLETVRVELTSSFEVLSKQFTELSIVKESLVRDLEMSQQQLQELIEEKALLVYRSGAEVKELTLKYDAQLAQDASDKALLQAEVVSLMKGTAQLEAALATQAEFVSRLEGDVNDIVAKLLTRKLILPEEFYDDFKLDPYPGNQLKTGFDMLLKKYEGSSAQIEDLILKSEKAVQTLKEESSNLRFMLESMQETCQLRDVELDSLKKRVEEEATTVAHKEKEIEDLLVQISSLSEQLEKGNTERKSLQAGLAQAEQKLLVTREKLSLAVIKGKAVVQQRDAWKLSAAEKAKELDAVVSAYQQDHQMKDDALHEAEMQIKRLAASVEQLPRLETEVGLLQNLVGRLEEVFQDNDNLVQSLFRMLDSKLVPHDWQSSDLADKVAWIIGSFNRLLKLEIPRKEQEKSTESSSGLPATTGENEVKPGDIASELHSSEQETEDLIPRISDGSNDLQVEPQQMKNEKVQLSDIISQLDLETSTQSKEMVDEASNIIRFSEMQAHLSETQVTAKLAESDMGKTRAPAGQICSELELSHGQSGSLRTEVNSLIKDTADLDRSSTLYRVELQNVVAERDILMSKVSLLEQDLAIQEQERKIIMHKYEEISRTYEALELQSLEAASQRAVVQGEIEVFQQKIAGLEALLKLETEARRKLESHTEAVMTRIELGFRDSFIETSGSAISVPPNPQSSTRLEYLCTSLVLKYEAALQEFTAVKVKLAESHQTMLENSSHQQLMLDQLQAKLSSRELELSDVKQRLKDSNLRWEDQNDFTQNLSKEVVVLREELVKAKTERDALQAEVIEAEQRLSITTEKWTLGLENSSSQQQLLDELQAKLSSREVELCDVNERIKESNLKCAEQKDIAQTLSEELARLREEFEKAKSEREALQAEVVQAEQRLLTTTETLSLGLENAASQQQMLEQVQQKLSSRELELGDLNKRMKESALKYAEQKDLARNLLEEVVMLREELGKAKNERDSLQLDIAEAEQRLLTAGENLSLGLANAVSQQEVLDKLQQNLLSREAEVGDMNKRLKESDLRYEEQKNITQTLSKELVMLREELVKVKSERDSLQVEVVQAEQSVSMTREKWNLALENAVSQQQVLEQLQQKLSSREVELGDVNKRMKESDLRFAEQRDLVKNLSEEVVMLREELIKSASDRDGLQAKVVQAEQRLLVTMEKLSLGLEKTSSQQQILDQLEQKLLSRETELIDVNKRMKDFDLRCAEQEDLAQNRSEEVVMLKGELVKAKIERDALQTEVIQAEQRLSITREKLSLAIKKGKGVVQQRDSLKQSLSELESQVTNIKQELQNKESALEDKISTLEEQVQELTLLLDSSRSTALTLEKDLIGKEDIIREIEVTLTSCDFPGEYQSWVLTEKLEWLIKSFSETQTSLILTIQEADASKKAAVQLHSELADAQRRVALELDLQSNLSVKLEQSDEQVRWCEKQIAKLETCLSATEEADQQAELLSERALNLEALLQQKHAEVSKAEEAVFAWAKRSEEAERYIHASQERISELEGKVQTLAEMQQQVELLQEKVGSLEQVVQQREIAVRAIDTARAKAVNKLTTTVNKFRELCQQSEGLVAELERMHVNIQEKDVEISQLKEEIIKITTQSQSLQETLETKKRFLLLLEKQLEATVFPGNASESVPRGVDQEQLGTRTADEGNCLAKVNLLRKQLEGLSSQSQAWQAAVGKKDVELQLLRKKLAEMVAENAAHLKTNLQREQFQSEFPSINTPRALKGSHQVDEIEEVTVGKPSSSLVPHVRVARKTTPFDVAIDVGMETNLLLKDSDDKGHGFRSLASSWYMPTGTRSIAQLIDRLCVAGGRVLMRQPGARLGLTLYWLAIHIWMILLIFTAHA